MQRRQFLAYSMTGVGIIALAPYLKATKAFAFDTASKIVDKLIISNEAWKKLLTSQQYEILREEGTEHPFTSVLLNEHRAGTFVCSGCDLPLFPSKFKFDSGTGWPSFFDAIGGHIERKSDHKLWAERTEYHCARCGGHHGHVFNDGPQPTGLRYCNNGAVLKFIPREV